MSPAINQVIIPNIDLRCTQDLKKKTAMDVDIRCTQDLK